MRMLHRFVHQPALRRPVAEHFIHFQRARAVVLAEEAQLAQRKGRQQFQRRRRAAVIAKARRDAQVLRALSIIQAMHAGIAPGVLQIGVHAQLTPVLLDLLPVVFQRPHRGAVAQGVAAAEASGVVVAHELELHQRLHAAVLRLRQRHHAARQNPHAHAARLHALNIAKRHISQREGGQQFFCFRASLHLHSPFSFRKSSIHILTWPQRKRKSLRFFRCAGNPYALQ